MVFLISALKSSKYFKRYLISFMWPQRLEDTLWTNGDWAGTELGRAPQSSLVLIIQSWKNAQNVVKISQFWQMRTQRIMQMQKTWGPRFREIGKKLTSIGVFSQTLWLQYIIHSAPNLPGWMERMGRNYSFHAIEPLFSRNFLHT